MNIFDRLPAGLFAPLHGPNSRRTWDLISRLGENYFGADAVPPHPDGYLHEDITKEVERFLLDQNWEHEREGEASTPLNVQANLLLRRLVDTGWLVEEQIGAKFFVSMRPVVSRFFETLRVFAEEGPQVIGGNVQLVHNQLLSVRKNPREQAQGFASAAALCVRLISALNVTTLRARDLMKELMGVNETAAFVRRFFSEHIAEIYVRDFQDLRTENHPIRLRWDIIEIVRDVTTNDGSRAELLGGYLALTKPGERAEDLLERDVRKFERLLDVERLLERMDEVMEQATQRAIAYLAYRLKASERLDVVISDAVQAIKAAEAGGIEITGRLIAPTPVVSEERLRMPLPPPTKPSPKAMLKRQMTIHERALLMLRREMTAHRDDSPGTLRRWVSNRLADDASVDAQNLPTERIEDAVAFLALVRLGSMLKNNPKAARESPRIGQLGFRVSTSTTGKRVSTSLFDAPAFTIDKASKNAS